MALYEKFYIREPEEAFIHWMKGWLREEVPLYTMRVMQMRKQTHKGQKRPLSAYKK